MSQPDQSPPYHTPIYLESAQLGQVAEVTQDDSSGNRFLDTDYMNAAESAKQQWNLDPSDMSRNEYSV